MNKIIALYIALFIIPFIMALIVSYLPNHLGKQWIAQASEILNNQESTLKLIENKLNKTYAFFIITFVILGLLQLNLLNETPFITSASLLIFMAFMLCISAIDLKYKIIPDYLSLPLLWIGLLVNQSNVFTQAQNSVYGAALGYAFLWSISYIFLLAKKGDVLGGGDLKLIAAIGAWGGWQILPNTLTIASLLGILHWLILYKINKVNEQIPFAPSIALSGCFFLTYNVAYS